MIVEPVRIECPPPVQTHARTPGVHQSAIIKGIALETGILTPQNAEEDADFSLDAEPDQAVWWASLTPEAKLNISMGLAWEQYYIPLLPTVVDHPGEMELDGIYMTPDGEELFSMVVEGRPRTYSRIHEVKYTRKSTNTVTVTGPDAFGSQWMWLAQMKGYCWRRETPFACAHVYFALGNYRWPYNPELWQFNLQFSEEELYRNWQLLKRYRDERIRVR